MQGRQTIEINHLDLREKKTTTKHDEVKLYACMLTYLKTVLIYLCWRTRLPVACATSSFTQYHTLIT